MLLKRNDRKNRFSVLLAAAALLALGGCATDGGYNYDEEDNFGSEGDVIQEDELFGDEPMIEEEEDPGDSTGLD
ncbi:hypothetical protein [Thiohalorhabdus methylotrophus]|uniref:Uncharacterized protein n=1 Tax=Thiohalorhabdus methylotrophus TaxID=3242694 RepID=A0ABV4TSV3_9GAMM